MPGSPGAMVQALYRRELAPWALSGFSLGMVEGATAAVLVKKGFADLASPEVLNLAVAFVSGAPHVLSMTGITDLAGLLLADTSAAFAWYVPEPVVSGDILINEVLFNAREDGVEFVEIYNASQKVVKQWSNLFHLHDVIYGCWR